MNEQNMIWLSTSLFSNKKNWHRVLSEAVAPFTESNTQINAYQVEFNYLSGENIRLSLLTELGNKEALSRKADNYFKNYFANAGLFTAPVKLPVDGMFMPFPANTIQYGLYPPKTVNTEEPHHYIRSANLSKIILNALNDEIDDDTTITFAYYLHIALIKAIHGYVNDPDVLFTIITANSSANVSNIHEPSVTANIDLMVEITHDVMKNEVFDIELDWLNNWFKLCKIYLQDIDNSTLDSASLNEYYQSNVGTIYKHLGLNAHGQYLLFCFISKALAQYFMITTKEQTEVI